MGGVERPFEKLLFGGIGAWGGWMLGMMVYRMFLTKLSFGSPAVKIILFLLT